MDSGRAWYALSVTAVLAAALVLGVGAGFVPLSDDGGGTPGTPTDCGTTDPATDRGAPSTPVEDARVTVVDENGTRLANVSAVVADTSDEHYTGLSDTESLADGEGMLFVFDEESTRHFVMRRMDFPLDMIFVGSDRTITVIHHAALRENQPPGAEPYSGQAKWVLEVPRGYTNETGVTAGDCIRIEYAEPETPTDGGNRTA